MTKTIQIAPVRKTLIVKAPKRHAFEVFTAGIDTWWPKSHGIGSSPVIASIMEPRVGGRWFTRHEDGAELTVGHMRVWDAPDRIVFSWDINAQWKPDATVASEVEVRFIADDAQTTRIELEHRDFEAMGETDGNKMRNDVNGGWPGLLEMFKQAAEA